MSFTITGSKGGKGVAWVIVVKVKNKNYCGHLIFILLINTLRYEGTNLNDGIHYSKILN